MPAGPNVPTAIAPQPAKTRAKVPIASATRAGPSGRDLKRRPSRPSPSRARSDAQGEIVEDSANVVSSVERVLESVVDLLANEQGANVGGAVEEPLDEAANQGVPFLLDPMKFHRVWPQGCGVVEMVDGLDQHRRCASRSSAMSAAPAGGAANWSSTNLSATSSTRSTMSSRPLARWWIASRSNGVTKVCSSRSVISWFRSSPACSSSRSLAEAAAGSR